MIDFFFKYKYIIVPTLVWIGIQLFKVIYKRIDEKVWDFTRFWGAGGMPSSHSATVMCITTMIGKNMGIDSPVFAVSLVFALIVMYDATGVRRAVGKQAHVINNILKNQKLSNYEKLQEMTGHTPIQVIMGAFIGFIVGICF